MAGIKDQLSNIVNVMATTTPVNKVCKGTTLLWQRSGFTAFPMATTGDASSAGCGTTIDTTRYHNGTGSLPKVGDMIFIDSAGNNVFIGGEMWYKVENGNPGKTIYVDMGGNVTQTSTCNLL